MPETGNQQNPRPNSPASRAIVAARTRTPGIASTKETPQPAEVFRKEHQAAPMLGGSAKGPFLYVCTEAVQYVYARKTAGQRLRSWRHAQTRSRTNAKREPHPLPAIDPSRLADFRHGMGRRRLQANWGAVELSRPRQSESARRGGCHKVLPRAPPQHERRQVRICTERSRAVDHFLREEGVTFQHRSAGLREKRLKKSRSEVAMERHATRLAGASRARIPQP